MYIASLWSIKNIKGKAMLNGSFYELTTGLKNNIIFAYVKLDHCLQQYNGKEYK